MVLVAALALATVASAAGYYLPGTYPQEFYVGQQLQGMLRLNAVYVSPCGSLLVVKSCHSSVRKRD